MNLQKSLAVIAVIFAAMGIRAAAAADSLDVSLWSKPDREMMTQMGIGEAAIDPATVSMGITVSKPAVAAGEVTFNVKNDSADMVHEMVVIPIANTTDRLPFIDAEGMVDEDKAGAIGEVSELDPGASGSVTLDLKPGLYALICNVPGHYEAGMWTIIKAE